MIKSILNTIPFLFAARAILVLNLIVILFHLLVLTQLIPFNNVWGGQLKNENEMHVFESVSIMINCILIITVLIKIRKLKAAAPHKATNVILWIFVVIFGLNTIGNLMAKTTLETFIATPLTFMLAVLCIRVALEKRT